jgi:predicted regulator of Ras-like GTPase activity (Roadblock/LC7/MglB family)
VFDEVLKRLLDRVEGAGCALLASRDGMVVASASRPQGASPELVAAGMADLFGRAVGALREAELGSAVELTAGGENAQIALRQVVPGYVVALALAPGGSLGRARYELRLAASLLEPELA